MAKAHFTLIRAQADFEIHMLQTASEVACIYALNLVSHNPAKNAGASVSLGFVGRRCLLVRFVACTLHSKDLLF